MKIAMVGAGAAGSVFASYLRRGGADMTLVDLYKAHMDKVAADGMDFTIAPDRHYHVDGFKTAYNADSIGIQDIVIFVTKATQIESALETAKPCIGPDTVLVSLMNGVGNEDYLLKAVDGKHVIYGSGTLGTALPEPGKCISSPGLDEIQMNFGPVEKCELTDRAGKHLEKCFNEGGCPSKYWDDVRLPVWTKATVNCTFNPLSAILRMKVNVMENNEYGWTLIEQMTRECCAVANAKGVALDADSLIAAYHKSEGTPITNYYPSMAQDMLIHERQTEINTLNGVISRYGKELGIPTPLNDIIFNMVSATQLNYDNLFPKVQ